MAAGKQKNAATPHPPPPAAATADGQSKKSKKKKRAAAKARRDDVDALAPSDTLDFGTLPAPDEGLAEAIAAVLEAPRVAANGGGAGGRNSLGVAGADATAAAQAELLATANELYQRMDAGGGGLRPDGAYWAALPAHIRNFVRTASLSPPLRAADGNERAKAQAMYAIAQQMAQTGEQGESQIDGDGDGDDAPEGDVVTTGGLAAGSWQGEMSLPVDPSFFADAEFTAALEQQREERGVIGVGVGVAEVKGCEGGDLRELRTGNEEAEWTGRCRSGVGGTEDDREIPTRDGKLVTSSAVSDSELLPKAEAAAAAPAPATTARAKAKAKANTEASALNNMPPHAKQPSSRAQGKQPMNYPPPPPSAAMTTTSTTASTTAQQKTNAPSPTTRSSRAASKAPLQPHAYPHTHPHHHPSPPSSNTSQTQKHRPSSNQAPSSRNTANAINKIWSTSSTEERERIKEFWLGLGEQDRRNLVKLEKEAVLKKMKEQQRHSCACAVCGRKRCVYQF
jgi:Salt tolerance down-regulator